MSDETIRPGDLVRVVRDCCGAWVGMIFEAGEVGMPWTPNIHCGLCMWSSTAMTGVFNAHWRRGSPYFAPLSWLKKIPPLWELDETETKEEIPA